MYGLKVSVQIPLVQKANMRVWIGLLNVYFSKFERWGQTSSESTKYIDEC